MYISQSRYTITCAYNTPLSPNETPFSHFSVWDSTISSLVVYETGEPHGQDSPGN